MTATKNFKIYNKYLFSIDGDYTKIYQDKKFVVIGNFAVFFINKKKYSINNLRKLLLKYNIESLISNSIGKYFIFDKEELNIYTSLNFSSLYYNNNCFYNLEKNLIKKIKKKKIFDINFFIKSHRHIAQYPFDGILKGVNRIPPGFKFDIKKKKNYLIIKKNNIFLKKDEKQYLILLDQIFIQYKKFYKKNFQLAFSGGMDSTVLFLLMVRNKFRFSAYHNIIGETYKISIDYILCNYLSKKFKVPLSLKFKQKKKHINQILSEFKSHYSFHFKARHLDKEPAYITKKNFVIGQNLDTLYYIDTFAPNTYKLLHQRYYGILKTLHLRFFYTHTFIKFFLFFLKRSNPIKNFFLKVWTTEDEHVPYLSNNIKSKIKNSKRKSYFNKKVLPILIKENDAKSFLKNLKILKFMRFVINTNQLYEIFENHYKCKILTPYSESIIQNYFFNRSTSVFESFYIKFLQDYVIILSLKINFHFLQIYLKLKSKIFGSKNIRIKKN